MRKLMTPTNDFLSVGRSFFYGKEVVPMALSFALIMFFGMVGHLIFTKLKLPGLLGMLIIGMLIGPHCLNWINQSVMDISSDLRKIALIIILLRAGLGINRNELKKVGTIAIKMSFLPGLFEGLTVAVVSIFLLDLDFIRGGMLGFILAAVSPAVVVPLMLKFMDEGLGKKKGIPTLILSAASIDDVFAITIFTTFMGIYANKSFNITLQLLNIPISIILGILFGLLVGMILIYIFNKFHIRDSKKTILLLSIAILMVVLQDALENIIMIASLIGVMSLGFIISETKPQLGIRLASKFGKMWLFAELFLFVLVGAEVNIRVAMNAGLLGLIVILLGLIGRSMGVILSTYHSELNLKERSFLIIAYLPKATVQAAIGSIPLSKNIIGGELILAIAVLSIVFTAPLGAIGINHFAPKLLK